MSDDYFVLVGGDRAAGGRGTYDIVNPATEEVVGRAPEVSVGQVEAATRAAAEAFAAWSRTSPQHRSELLARLADVLDGQSEGLVPLAEWDPGEPPPQPGDKVEVLLEGMDDDTGEVVLSRTKAHRIRALERVISVHREGAAAPGP